MPQTARHPASSVRRDQVLRPAQTRVQVLRGCSLDGRPGEVVVVCGPSGSGKSTLIKCVNALEPFQPAASEVAGTTSSATRAPSCAEAPRPRRHGVPALRAVPPPHARAGQPLPRPDARSSAAPGPRSPRQGQRLCSTASAWPDHAQRAYPGQLSRRPAAARRHRPRPGHGPGRHAVRRAHLRPRPRDGQRGPRRHDSNSPAPA